jgi:hypothetical protein
MGLTVAQSKGNFTSKTKFASKTSDRSFEDIQAVLFEVFLSVTVSIRKLEQTPAQEILLTES